MAFLKDLSITSQATIQNIHHFVCFSSKATHLELVSDLSTNNCLLCINRFVGRHGIPNRLYCDNVINFVGGHY